MPANPADFRGYRPMASEIAAVPDTIDELQGFADYGSVFGITAPPASELSAGLSVAAQWTSVLSETTAWLQYVKSEEGTAWKDAMLLVEKMKPAFQLASAANPALHTQYPALARLLGASQVAAKRAVATKKRTTRRRRRQRLRRRRRGRPRRRGRKARRRTAATMRRRRPPPRRES